MHCQSAVTVDCNCNTEYSPKRIKPRSGTVTASATPRRSERGGLEDFNSLQQIKAEFEAKFSTEFCCSGCLKAGEQCL